MATISNVLFLDSEDKPVLERLLIVRMWSEYDSDFLEIKAPHDGESYLFNLMGRRENAKGSYAFLRLPAPLCDGVNDYLIVLKDDPPDGLLSIPKDELQDVSKLWNVG